MYDANELLERACEFLDEGRWGKTVTKTAGGYVTRNLTKTGRLKAWGKEIPGRIRRDLKQGAVDVRHAKRRIKAVRSGRLTLKQAARLDVRHSKRSWGRFKKRYKGMTG